MGWKKVRNIIKTPDYNEFEFVPQPDITFYELSLIVGKAHKVWLLTNDELNDKDFIKVSRHFKPK